MKYKALLLVLLISHIHAFGQESPEKKEVTIDHVENFLLKNQLDSAKITTAKLPQSPYLDLLVKVAEGKKLTYKEYYRVSATMGNKREGNYKGVSDFIDSFIPKPTNQQKIDLYYVEIKWVQTSKLRDQGLMQEASESQKELLTYIDTFKSTDTDVVFAKTKATTHDIVMYQIQKDFEKGKNLCLKSLETAKELKDKKLQIVFLYHLCDYLILEGKLQEYIDTSEEGYKLEKQLENTTSYYFATIEHLLDAYLYKGGHEERVQELLSELYEGKHTRISSYVYYAKYVSSLSKNSPQKKKVLEKFEVNSVIDFVKKVESLAENHMVPNNFFYLLQLSSKALEANGDYTEALLYKDKCIALTRKIYSEDLSESLANFKTDIAVKEKEKEISHEKEKTRLYIVIASLVGFLLLISIYISIKLRNQSQVVKKQNETIKQTLEEKELLVKEVHHRVKNNFQIVSSLLELQSKGIEDEKALELANEGKNRVKSMALIHQKLYQNETGLVDFDEYIKLLVKEISSAYKGDKEITTLVRSEKMFFDVDTAIPLGLIINELITNSYKYAFSKFEDNQLSIEINKQPNNEYQLIIEDNGGGLSKDFDVKKAKSLGLRLVNRLVKQLHGSLILNNEEGTRFEIMFKDQYLRKQVL